MSNNLTTYNARRAQIRTGDAILWRSDTVLGRLIQWRTGSPYNHVSIAVRYMEYDIDRVFVLEELEHGAQLYNLSSRLSDHKGKAWLFPLVEDLAGIRIGMGRAALSLVGTPYDYKGLVDNIGGRIKSNDKKLICSEYYWTCLLKQRFPTANIQRKLLEIKQDLGFKVPTPADFTLFQKHGLMGKEVEIL